MAVSVRHIIKEIIRREGGYVNHPNDRGGPTKYGVTHKTLSRYLKREASIEDVKHMTEETAYEIYERDYYEGPRINTLPAPLRSIVTDASVLYGPRRAIKFVQQIVNEAGFAHRKMGKFLINAYVEERIEFCERIVHNNPSQSVFLKGWTNRANEFRVR
jgi:lysozyme family protein